MLFIHATPMLDIIIPDYYAAAAHNITDTKHTQYKKYDQFYTADVDAMRVHLYETQANYRQNHF